MASLTFNPRDNEIVWATPGTIAVDGCILRVKWAFR